MKITCGELVLTFKTLHPQNLNAMIRCPSELLKGRFCVRRVVVVDSHVQRIVLATEETTVTQQVSHRPIKCQSRLWSQRGTKKVNGSHRSDNPLLRLTGIQIATKQPMFPPKPLDTLPLEVDAQKVEMRSDFS